MADLCGGSYGSAAKQNSPEDTYLITRLIVIPITLFLAGPSLYGTGVDEREPIEFRTQLVISRDDTAGPYGSEGLYQAYLLAKAQLEDAGLPTTMSTMSDNQPDAILMAANRSDAIATTRMAIGQNVIVMSATPMWPELSSMAFNQEQTLLVSTAGSHTRLAEFWGKTASNSANSASIVYAGDHYGEAMARAFEDSFAKRGGRQYSRTILDPSAKSEALTTVFAAEESPDVVAVFGHPDEVRDYIKLAISEYGYHDFLVTDYLDLGIDAARYEGVQGVTLAARRDESYKRFSAQYFVTYGTPPVALYAGSAYDGLAALGLAAYASAVYDGEISSFSLQRHLRSVSSPPGEIVRPGEFRRAFALIDKGKPINYEGAFSTLDFDSQGSMETLVLPWSYNERGTQIPTDPDCLVMDPPPDWCFNELARYRPEFVRPVDTFSFVDRGLISELAKHDYLYMLRPELDHGDRQAAVAALDEAARQIASNISRTPDVPVELHESLRYWESLSPTQKEAYLGLGDEVVANWAAVAATAAVLHLVWEVTKDVEAFVSFDQYLTEVAVPDAALDYWNEFERRALTRRRLLNAFDY